MNGTSRTLTLLLLTVLSLASFLNLDAYPITDIGTMIYDGSKWTMNINGEVQPLVIRMRRGASSSQLDHNFKWGDRSGYLIASTESSGSVRSVKFYMSTGDNTYLSCEGKISRYSDDLMAGVCGKSTKVFSFTPTGAWYATRGSQYAPGGDRWKDEYDLCTQRENDCKRQLKLVRERGRPFGSVAGIEYSLSDPSPKSRSSSGNTNKLNEPSRDLPNLAPRNGDINSFLNEYNREFFRILQILFDDQSELNEYQNIERSKCGDFNYPTFCQMVVRQDAIYLMLKGNE
jgi:hypothetical protein